ncbi:MULTISPECIES: glutaredoxin family protein [unclassified Blastococcus]|uniref:glutaredoxin family protein n=1 Tax=unclassified Blastococcus TaxID=2619396 RepID=UPI001EEF7CAE|nr:MULTISPECIES: glutaredoxin family protein [unclassified Blastococcus]
MTVPVMTGVRPPVAAAPVTVYGNRWCGITQMTRRILDRAGVPYRYVDLDLHPEMKRRLRWMAGGDLRNPVVNVAGEWLEQPTPRELQWVLARHGLI